ncbi:MAG: glycosyltransferase family 4 protein [Candidatus Electrothrix sp. GW3-4]|uniref:glycosyltransferase family 4 protein n=1 Tax=Candidatus Electrothrix sp. GW3-4 TaxID=3126740 RepID=UPI0030CED501
MKKILIIGAYPPSLVNFRGDFISTLVQSGHQVTAMAAPASQETIIQLQSLGADFRAFPIQRNGLNPWNDFKTFISLYKIFCQEKPDIVFAYTIKPVIFGGFAISCLNKNVPFYALITGLGYVFEGKNTQRRLLRKIASWLYNLSLRKATRVIFQNYDNQEKFVKKHIVSADKCAVVDGSGVDIKHFQVAQMKAGKPIFLLIARLLQEKGIREYTRAARKVKERYPDAVFNVLGPEDPSPDGVSITKIQAWHDKGIIQYLGVTDDVRPFLTSCHAYVLPSYHEGMPRSVLEAMATGRPVLTTDTPGCRETVIQGENGFLVPVRNAEALAERMTWFIEHPEEWKRMGKRSREIAEEKFDVQKINKELMAIMGLEQSNTNPTFYKKIKNI